MTTAAKPALATRYRDLAIEVEQARIATRAEGDERIPIAFSSEAPVERFDWWEGERYFEVLDHSPESVDLSYARDGIPFLADHNTREQLGLVEDVTIDGDRRCRGMLRMSKGARAQEVLQDIRDGIRKKVSVGYKLSDNYEQTKAKEGELPVRRYTRWTPMEASSVAIPADYDVGFGRSAPGAAPSDDMKAAFADFLRSRSTAPAAKEHTMSDKDTAAGNGAATVTDSAAERKRSTEIMQIAQQHGQDLARALAWISEGKSADAVRGEILAGYRSGEIKLAPPAPAADVKLTEKEQRQYSIVRGLQALILNKRGHAGFEMEVSETVGKQLGRDTQGFFVPTSIDAVNPDAVADTPAARQASGLGTRTQLSLNAGAGKGTESKFTEYAGFIDLLRNKAQVIALGAKFLPGLQGDVGFVGQSGAGVVGWNTEVVNQALSSLSLALRTMTPKNLQSATTYSRQMLLQSVLSIENLVRSDIAALHGLEIDRATLNGSGAAGQPRGIINTAGIGSVVGGANGIQPTYDHMVDLETEVAVDNADVSTLGYLAHTRIRGRLKKTPELANTAGLPVWRGNEVNGYAAAATNQLPTGQTKGTSTDCSPIVFGAFGEVIIGEWGAMEMLVDPLTLGPTIVKVMSIEFIDIFLRYVEAFAVMADARV